MAVTFLAQIADQLLAAAQAALVASTTGRPAPSSAYVSNGPPAADNVCDGGQITVHLAGVTHPREQSASNERACDYTPRATFVVTLMRCVTGIGGAQSRPTTPTSAALDSDAGDLLADLWALLTELYDRGVAGTLVSGLDTCDIDFGDAEPLDVDGDVAGWVVPVLVDVIGPGPAGS